jgi:hypothetical protein
MGSGDSLKTRKGIMALRMYADFNSGTGTDEDPYWCLRYGSPLRPLDEVAAELNLCEGMPELLYYEDRSEEFEVSAVLVKRGTIGPQWHACADWDTMRRIR